MTRTTPDAPVAPTLAAYREQFLRNATPRNSSYLQAKVREQHDGLVIIELSSYLDTGGAHGTPGRGFINYSRQQHKVLTLSDMLLPGQEEAFWKAAQVAHNSWLISTKLDQEPEFLKQWSFQKNPTRGADLRRGDPQVRSEHHRAIRPGPHRIEDRLPTPQWHPQARAVPRP
nr:hypothetical protein GCM10020185_24790 [Pseudomonas brassicacearum subsp. brassicacearum]